MQDIFLQTTVIMLFWEWIVCVHLEHIPRTSKIRALQECLKAAAIPARTYNKRAPDVTT